MDDEQAGLERVEGRLAGKVAFITGVGGGIGRVAAQWFAAAGAHVVGCDLSADEAAETAEIVRRRGGRMRSMAPVDLGDREQAKAWVDEGVAEAGRIDVLYNNAGGVRMGLVAEVTPDDWAFTVRNDLDATFWASQAAWPHLVAAGGGAIVNTASLAGARGWATFGASAHAASKAGVLGLTRQLAAEGATDRIRVNAISPGVIGTPPVIALRDQGLLPPLTLPLGRLGAPEDIVRCAIFLASDDASWITAANFVVDGGASIIEGIEPT